MLPKIFHFQLSSFPSEAPYIIFSLYGLKIDLSQGIAAYQGNHVHFYFRFPPQMCINIMMLEV